MSVKFSVIIPVYNAGKYIITCLNSIISQRYNKFEIILVNDGSTDDSLNRIKQFQDSHNGSNLILIDKKNEGPIKSRLRGLQEATGDYIIWMDADDEMSDNYFEEISNTINFYFYPDVVMYNYCNVDDQGIIIRQNRSAFGNGRIEKKEIIYKFLTTSDINTVWMKCIKRKIAQSINYPILYQNIKMGEDIVLSLPILYESNSFVYNGEVLYRYRKIEDSITANLSKNHLGDALKIRRYVYEYIKEKDPEKLSLVYDRFFHIITGYMIKFTNIYSRREYKLIYQSLKKEEIYLLMNEHIKEVSVVNKMRCFAICPNFYYVLKIILKFYR